MNKSSCIYLFTVLMVCVHCGTFHIEYCEQDNITHYYIADSNHKADFRCHTTETVLDESYIWKLKRPDNTMTMLPDTDANYEITNVRTTDEGSYSCTFNTSTNKGVPGDNTLCLVTLALPVPNFFHIENTTIGSNATFNISIGYNMTGSTEAVLPVSRVQVIKDNVVEFVCSSTISTPTKDNIASCNLKTNGMLSNRLSLKQENSYIESFEVILHNVSNSDEGNYALNVQATFSTTSNTVTFSYSSTWTAIATATLIVSSIQPATTSMMLTTEPSGLVNTMSSDVSSSTTTSSASLSVSTDLISVTESTSSLIPTATNMDNINPFIIAGSAIAVFIAIVIIAVIVVIVLIIIKRERVGSFKLSNKMRGGDDETVTPNTGDGIELSRKGMSDFKYV